MSVRRPSPLQWLAIPTSLSRRPLVRACPGRNTSDVLSQAKCSTRQRKSLDSSRDALWYRTSSGTGHRRHPESSTVKSRQQCHSVADDELVDKRIEHITGLGGDLRAVSCSSEAGTCAEGQGLNTT